MIRRNAPRALVVALLAAPLLAATGHAQERGGVIYQTPYRALVGLNPLGIPFAIFSLEGEGVMLPGVTIGGSFGYSALGDDDDDGQGEGDARFTSGDVKLRYYPGEVGLRGFSVGLGVGVTRFSKVVNVGSVTTTEYRREAATGPTITVLADHNFLLGARERFVIGAGIGAKRFLAPEEDRDRADAPRAWAFVRFVVGIAF